MFGIDSRHVVATVCRGRVLLRDRQVLTVDEAEVAARGRERAARLWRRIR
jgi:hypothetical protein